MRALAVVILMFGVFATSQFATPTPTPIPSDTERALAVLKAINAARVANGLPPYAYNPMLAQSAQAHSEYMRDTGQVVHTGPGDLAPVDRVAATGYPYIRVGENIFAGIRGPDDAVHWWLTNDEAHRHNVLHPDMREAGIGAATAFNGVTYYTLDIAAQPNVLPVSINSADDVTKYPTVVITLTNETMWFGGGGRVGSAVQVMVSNSFDFKNAQVQPWAQYINWTLDTSNGVGLKTVYVRYIDALGTTADSQDSILYDPRANVLPSATPGPTMTSLPTGTWTQPAISPTLPITDTPLPTSTETSTSTTTPTATVEPTIIATTISTILATGIPSIQATPEIGIVPEAAPNEQSLRRIFAGLLIAGIITIVIGILVLMRGLRAS